MRQNISTNLLLLQYYVILNNLLIRFDFSSVDVLTYQQVLL